MSVPKSMHRMVTVPSGSGMSHRMNAKKGEISGMLDVSVYAIDFFRLSKMRRPSSTPVTIEAKLSSSRIMSAAYSGGDQTGLVDACDGGSGVDRGSAKRNRGQHLR